MESRSWGCVNLRLICRKKGIFSVFGVVPVEAYSLNRILRLLAAYRLH